MELLIETPEKKFFSGEVESVIVDTVDGKIGVLSGHAPTVAALATGRVRIK
ncbi:MAG: F0F1 ATP synthase subunit epsilon, partial [Clostridiales bacterium]|nr:F0F1 ATP synthase subunit epsilon [Clostridiales bacterium]